MGNATSSASDEPQSNDDTNTIHEDDPFDGIETLGYRVLGVQPNSPASQAGLVSFLDFLIGCNDRMLLGSGEDLLPGMEYDDIDLPTLLNENKNIQLEFLVFNIKSQEARIVHLTPSDTWGGAGLLGVTIRLDNYAGAEDRFIRVLSVVENGPAAVSGLCTDGTDFILGTTHHTINSVSHFAQLLRDNIDRVIELYVYNSNTDVVRVVTLMPSYEWNTKTGGSGLFGAEVGTGYLHRLPYRSRFTSGTCVERKVRYVTQTSTSNDKEAKVVLMEDAPQMEMEPPDPDDEEDDEHVEEVFCEPKREHSHVANVLEQVSGSGTAEDIPTVHQALQKQTNVSEEPRAESDNAVMTTGISNGSSSSSYQQHQQQQAVQKSSPPPHLPTTAAAATIFGQPLVAPPLLQSQNQPPSRSTTTAASVLSPFLGPPPPPSYYSTTQSSLAVPAVSYAQPPSYYYGGTPQQQQATVAGNFSYAPPPAATTMMMPPPPPVGGVWNHAKASNQ